MTLEEFVAENWIDHLVPALRSLAEVQEPYLQEYCRQNPRVHVVFDERSGNPPAFQLDDLRDLYAMAYHSKVFGKEEYYAPLCSVLDPARGILRSHPTLARIASPIIGQDEFCMDILNTSNLTSPADLIAGLMARAAELSGDRFRTATGELNALLTPAAEGDPASGAGELDVGYDAVLFYGLTLKERIDFVDGMVILPFEHMRAFVDEHLVEELAPPGAGFHGWRSVGAVVRPFRWRPAFRRTGCEGEPELENPWPFLREAWIFLELLAVAHAAPVLCLATLAHCIDRSAGRLLGLADHSGSIDRGRSAQQFDGFAECLELVPEALAEAREAFENRKSKRYEEMAPIVGRLAEALARDGRFAHQDSILDVAIALERMYGLDGGEISHKMRTRIAWFLGVDAESRFREMKTVKEFYEARSAIVHNRKKKVSWQRNHEAFDKGFDIARRTLFKLLHEDPPENWDELVIAGN